MIISVLMKIWGNRHLQTLIDSKEFLNQNLKKFHKLKHGNSMYKTNSKDGNSHENEQIDIKMFFTHYVQQWNIRN